MSQPGSVKLENIVKRHGSFTALHGIDLEINPGEFFAFLGPSGSGKTTTLRILAGLEPVNDGRVLLDDVDVTHAQPGERDVAMVFQSYALYPHMTVAENIAFPLKMIRTPASTIESSVKEAAAKVGIEHLLARRPGQLSGGQQQRCALARAIVRKPRLFLLDEPLSNLDAKLRVETRAELRRLQRSLGVTTVYVTHDQEEAMTVADRLAVFMEGRIVQVGTPKEVFLRPANAVVAAFIGTPPMNLMPATLADGQVSLEGASLPISGVQVQGTRDVTLGVRPGDLRIADPVQRDPVTPDQGAPARGIPARVEFVEDLGDSVIAILTVGSQHIKMRLDQHADLQEGQQVFLTFAPTAAHLFDRQTGERLPSA